MTALEGGVAALATASGAAALAYTFAEYGVTTTFVDPSNLEELEGAIRENTKAVFIKTLGNPNSDIADMEAIAHIAHRHQIPLVIDNTFATPYLVRPIEYGADIVVHSATKRAILLRDTGATLSPFHAFMFLQGLETLSLRVERHVENALKVVDFLKSHPQAEAIHHPGVSGDPVRQALYQKFFPRGGGSIFTFEIKGGAEKARTYIDNLELFSLLANVADVKSLVIHPASTTHSQLNEAFSGLIHILDTTRYSYTPDSL